MASPSNRRTAPYVIMNNHSQPPSVAYSARQPDQQSTLRSDDGIETLVDTPLQSINPDHIHVTTTSLFALVRRTQVCRSSIGNILQRNIFVFLQQAFRFLGVSIVACCISTYFVRGRERLI